ncbi:hypothetical protein [Flavobacterium aestivum]|uniref:hypothetical protein n=1 Tax=Flavobacterium aestivum TaxID=3003257 RepID=UPI0022858ED4|nr:hypothetical protein [Flavobacterium aestivum]
MDWRYNTIWFEQINSNKVCTLDYKEKSISSSNFDDIEYGIIWYFKYKGISFDLLPKSEKLLYLEINSANFKDFIGVKKYGNLKRLELHYCTKLENDLGLSSLKNTLEFLHINQSKKIKLSKELSQLKKLKVLCLNNCGPLENLIFLNDFPNLIDFRFVNTDVLDGDLSPILKHPTLRTVSFSDKRHFNYKNDEIKLALNLKSTIDFKDFVYKGEYKTFKYNYSD